MTQPNDRDRQKITQAVRIVLGRGERFSNHKRPAKPRGGGGTLKKPQYRYQMPWSQAQNAWAWALGPVAHPAIVPTDDT